MTTSSLVSTLFTKPAEVPTMFLSLQNFDTSLNERIITILQIVVLIPVVALNGVELAVIFWDHDPTSAQLGQQFFQHGFTALKVLLCLKHGDQVVLLLA